MLPQVSLIVTVYNEEHSIRRLLDSLVAQNRSPDQVIFCDAGSQDNTVVILESYQDRIDNLQVIRAPGANISQGRNLAIAAADGPIIAVTDAGVRLDPFWLERLAAPFSAENAQPEQAVAGFFVPDPTNTFETAMAATVLPLATEIEPGDFLPSSRSVAFHKDIWQKIGGYPEWLDYSEDLVFDLRIKSVRKEAKPAFDWAPDAVVYFRPRSSLAAFWQQYFRYARGDGKADLWRKRHAIRYGTYLLLVPALIGHGLWGTFARGLGWVGLLLGTLAYCYRPWRRLRALGTGLSRPQQMYAALLVPMIRLVGDVAKMCGYPVGLDWRRRNRQRPEIHWRQDEDSQNF